MKPRPLAQTIFVVAGLAGQSLLAQTATDPRQPFSLDEQNRPIPRAVPVERPILRAVPVQRPTATALPVATPIPITSPANPRPAAPKPTPASTPTSAAGAPEPDDPGSIRVGPSVSSRTQDQLQLDLADSYYARKEFDQSAPEYERYLALYPNGPDRSTALFRLGESYRRNGVVNAARNSYETLLAQFQEGEFVGPASYRLAELYYQERQFRDALPLYRRASVRLKDSAVANSAKFYTGRCLEAIGQKLDARLVYEDLVSAVDNNPFQDASRLSLALLLKDGGRTAEALKQIQALAKQTDNPDLKIESLVRSGLWLIELQQPAKAEAELKNAAEMGGSSKWREVAQLGLLRLQFDSGKYDQVIAAYEAGPQISVENKPELLLLTANAYRAASKPAQALALYEQIGHDFPDAPAAREAQYERLKSLYYSEDASLIPEIDKYLVTNPDPKNRDQVMLMKAEMFFKKQDYNNALPLYSALELSTTLSPTLKAESIFKLGFCQMQAHDLDRAIKAFTSFVDGYSTHKSVSYALIQRGLAYQQQKNLASALKDYSQIIAKFPKAKERELALQQKALILGQQGDNATMSDTFQLLLKDYPNTAARAEANYWIGWAAYEAKNYQGAVAPLNTARELDREQFSEKAGLRVLLSEYYLEDKAATAREVDLYNKEGKTKVPPEILRWLGTELYKGGTYDQAEKYFTLLTPRDEAVADDFLFLGRSQLKLGKFNDATTALQSYLKTVKNPIARATGLLELAQAQIGVKSFADAQQAVDEALSLQPEGPLNGEGRIAAGDIQTARGNDEEAAKLYQSVSVVLDEEAVTPRALEKAVAAYKSAGLEAEAKKALNTLQSRYPEYYQRSAKTP